jgi:hypothetical protein
MKLDVGYWYVQPYKHMALEDIARDVGVLKDWETIAFEQ